MKKGHNIVLDWDGTLVPSMWPEQPTEFLPGAVQALFTLHRAGHQLIVHSARLTPYDPVTSRKRDPGIVKQEVDYVRRTLDDKGLTFVKIWTLPGKPPGSAYVDDKAYRYTGRPRSWHAMTEKLLIALGGEESVFGHFDLEAAHE